MSAAGGPTPAALQALTEAADTLDEPDRSLIADAVDAVSGDLVAFETGAIGSFDTGDLADIVADLCPDPEVFASVISR